MSVLPLSDKRFENGKLFQKKRKVAANSGFVCPLHDASPFELLVSQRFILPYPCRYVDPFRSIWICLKIDAAHTGLEYVVPWDHMAAPRVFAAR